MTKEFILDIVENKIRESDRLEFKNYYFENGKLNDIGTKQVNTLIREICSFANSNGGKIIIGIKEDDSRNPEEISNSGIDEVTFETWEQSLRNKIATTTIPVIYGIEIELVRINDGTTCIIIEIPRSTLKPHAFDNGSKDEFYIRMGNIKTPMRYNEIKNNFNALEFTQEKIKRFINNRISFILDGSLDTTMSTDSSLVIHIIPEWSLDESNFLDLRNLKHNNNLVHFAIGRRWQYIFNADGLIDIYGSKDIRKIMSYIQIFRNGVIESTEISWLNDIKDNHICDLGDLEKKIVERIYQYIYELRNLKVYGGYYICISLLNLKGKKVLYDGFPIPSDELLHNIVQTPLIKWSPNEAFENTMYPILTSIAYTFGLEKSTLYNDDLTPIQEKFAFLNKYPRIEQY